MSDKIFDCARDNVLIKAGTHFYCHSQLTAQPLTERSPDPRYCQNCRDYLCREADLLSKSERGDWVPTDWVPKTPTAANPVPPVAKTAMPSSPAGGEVVSKIPDKDILPTGDVQAQDNGIMKHRGRPQKSGEVSRTTAWRRRKDGLAS